jgi:phosphatidylglycerophosphate synthase
MLRRLKTAFFAAGILGMGIASMRATGDSTVVPSWHVVAAATVLLAASLAAAAAAWAALLPGAPSRRGLVRGFVAAQLGKYIPGGIWLAAGQVGLACDAGVPLGRALGAFAACAVAIAVAGAFAAGLLATVVAATSAATTAVLVASVAGLGVVLLLDRRWMTWSAARAARWRRFPDRGIVVPPQRAILGSFAWLVVTLLSMALAYALLLGSVGGGDALVRTMFAFSVAWLVGFLAPGVPSGIGAREAVLVALLPDDAGLVLAASVAHRVLQMATEAAFVLATREWREQARAGAAWVRARIHLLPNLLSGLRVALVPLLWVAALRGEPRWLVAGLVLAGITDLLDGQLARRLHATSRFGAQLDSLGDNLLALSGAVWLVLLRPDILAEFLTPLQALLSMYLAFLLVGWAKFRRFGNLHFYSAKLSAVLLYAFLIHSLWFADPAVVLFHVMAAVTALALTEGLVYQLISRDVDEHSRSLLLVLRRRRVGGGHVTERPQVTSPERAA